MFDPLTADPLSIPAMLVTALRDLLEALDAELGPMDMHRLPLIITDTSTPLDEARWLGVLACQIAGGDATHPCAHDGRREAANDTVPLRPYLRVTRAQLVHTVQQMEVLLQEAKSWLGSVPC